MKNENVNNELQSGNAELESNELFVAIQELEDIITPRLTAYVLSFNATGSLHDPNELRHVSLRKVQAILEIMRVIMEHESASVVQAWMQGLNPELDDVSPLQVLRDNKEGSEAFANVLMAAKAFENGAY